MTVRSDTIPWTAKPKDDCAYKEERGIVYIPKDSIVHGLDPRTKLFALVAVSIGSLIASDLYALAIMLALVLGSVAVSGVLREWVHAMRILIPVLLITIVIDVFFTAARYPSGGVLYSGDFWFLHFAATWGTILFAASMTSG
jgi:energy-coupling factor transport system permease protein